MKLFGKEIKFNNNKIYHEGDKPKANDIAFLDGETFQQKLDNGSLRGQTGPQGVKGDTGSQGVKGDQGVQGPVGQTGPKGTDGFTWRPNVSGTGDLTWTKDSSSAIPSSMNIKGPKGDTGEQGPKGDIGARGPVGPEGPMGPRGSQGIAGTKGIDGITWRPSVDVNGNLTWTKNSTPAIPDSSNIKGPKGDKGDTGSQGPTGPKGADGLTTSITVNGQKYTHSSGNITLPNYLKETGGNITGSISSNLATGTYLEGNKGKALINSTNGPGAFTTIFKGNSTNGVFTFNTYLDTAILCYTNNKTISEETNTVNTRVVLLDENGNSIFPNAIRANEINGPNTIKLSRNSLYLGYFKETQTCDNLRLGNNLIVGDNSRNIHLMDIDGSPVRVCTSTIYTTEKWIKIGSRWLTVDTSAPSGAKGDIWIQCF